MSYRNPRSTNAHSQDLNSSMWFSCIEGRGYHSTRCILSGRCRGCIWILPPMVHVLMITPAGNFLPLKQIVVFTLANVPFSMKQI